MGRMHRRQRLGDFTGHAAVGAHGALGAFGASKRGGIGI